MTFIADFHIHSRFSRATSPEMNIESLTTWANIKGIQLLGTGDFTHPNYFAQIKLRLKPEENGLFALKKGNNPLRFILTTEISNMFSQDGRFRKVHTLIFAPSFEVVAKINERLKKMGGNLASDGRPIFGAPVKEIVKMILDISPDCFIVPAHAWTPHFSVFGSNSGFDSLEECFGEETKNIYCIETGLSSDPAMNWRLSALDRITLISNSDAHSPHKLGREANVFDCELSYQTILEVLKTKDTKRFLYTIEFFPEEGKYHFDGHRNCKIVFSPEESRQHKNICPVCKKPLTIGVMNRVEKLADRPVGFRPPNAIPARYLIPLGEIIADTLGVATGTTSVDNIYQEMIKKGGNEFNILLNLKPDEIARFAPERVAEGIKLMREGKVKIIPGHDGVYGKISIFDTPLPAQESYFNIPFQTKPSTGLSGQLPLF